MGRNRIAASATATRAIPLAKRTMPGYRLPVRGHLAPMTAGELMPPYRRSRF